MISIASGPVPIKATGTPVLSSTSSIKFFASFGRSLYCFAPRQFGKRLSSFVIAACVAPFILAVFSAKSKSNGAERLSLPVPAATSNHPLFCASSFVISPGNGPAPTLVMNDL